MSTLEKGRKLKERADEIQYNFLDPQSSSAIMFLKQEQ
jgi:hypothetical protein